MIEQKNHISSSKLLGKELIPSNTCEESLRSIENRLSQIENALKINRNKKNNLIAQIRQQTEILANNIPANNLIGRDSAITEFLISVLAETNQVTSFNFELQMVDNDGGSKKC